MTTARWPLVKASAWISIMALPYSRSYSALCVIPGSLPALRTGTNPMPSS